MSELELENERVHPPLTLEIEKCPVVNFAMQSNHVPVIRRLVIHNHQDAALYDVTLTIHSEPAFLYPYEKKLAMLPDRKSTRLNSSH